MAPVPNAADAVFVLALFVLSMIGGITMLLLGNGNLGMIIGGVLFLILGSMGIGIAIGLSEGHIIIKKEELVNALWSELKHRPNKQELQDFEIYVSNGLKDILHEDAETYVKEHYELHHK